MLRKARECKWQLVVAAMALYLVLWLLSFGGVWGARLTPLLPPDKAYISRPIELPYFKPSKPMEPGKSHYYSITGTITLPPLHTSDTLVIRTDNCPILVLINGKIPQDGPALPVQADCNQVFTQFLYDFKKAGLHSGANAFEVRFEDKGGAYGAEIYVKSVWLKKSLIFVVPLFLTILLCGVFGMGRATFRHATNRRVVLLLALGSFAVCLPNGILSQTYDESAHIAAGMQWWDRDDYFYEHMHMPLARIAGTALLYLADLTPPDYSGNFIAVGERILHLDGQYTRNLALARIGLLPFFILGGCLVYLWSRRLYGDQAGLLSLLFYVLSPMVVGHAGLAATDFTYTVNFVMSVFAFVLWLERPTRLHSLFLGVAVAMMAASKISAFVQFPVALILILEWHVYYLYHFGNLRGLPVKTYLRRGLLLVLPACLLLLDAIYMFDHFDSIRKAIAEAEVKNNAGQAIWLFGPLHNQAVWYYFPVAFFFKNPVPFILLFGFGIAWSFRRYAGLLYQHRAFFPVLAALGVVCSSTLSNINIGSRHVLPAFVLMTIPAGYALSLLWASRNKARKILAAVLVLWQVVAFVRVGPDYFTYFNLFAGSQPEKVLLDTDLDWGQDLLRLRNALKKRKIKTLTVCYFGEADLPRVLEANVTRCNMEDGKTRPTGWVAASIYMVHVKPFGTLLKGLPYTRIGKTFNLYYVKPETKAAPEKKGS